MSASKKPFLSSSSAEKGVELFEFFETDLAFPKLLLLLLNDRIFHYSGKQGGKLSEAEVISNSLNISQYNRLQLNLQIILKLR